MTDFLFLHGNFHSFINDTTGGVAQELSRQGERVARSMRSFINRPQPPARERRTAYNPPEGPPMRGTGNLLESVAVTEPLVLNQGIEVQVTIGSGETVRGGWNYAIVLRDGLHPKHGGQGYKFVDLDNLD